MISVLIVQQLSYTKKSKETVVRNTGKNPSTGLQVIDFLSGVFITLLGILEIPKFS